MSKTKLAEGPIPLCIASALHRYFREHGLKKTAKAISKETQVTEECAISLTPLFERLAVEVEREQRAASVAVRRHEASAKIEESGEEAKPSKKDKKSKKRTREQSEGSPAEKRQKEENLKPEGEAEIVDQTEEKGPLQRLNVDYWGKKAADRKLDNSFWAKGGDSFASKAAEEMIRVKGRDFRAEKAKKKRASWRGTGAIDTGINSIRIPTDDEA